jgi:hypothetical protein
LEAHVGKVVPGRYTAEIDGDFVVFLIGMRVNKPWLPSKWVPTFLAMTPMLKSLKADTEKGLLGAHLGFLAGSGPFVVQYWRSLEHLDRFSRDPGDEHAPRQRWFNTSVGYTGDVGIWHETYLVRADEFDAVYGNMPRFGLAAASSHVPIGAASPFRKLVRSHAAAGEEQSA